MESAAALGEALKTRVLQATPIVRGGNNQAWKLETEAGPYFVKRYFADDRNRQATEWAFLEYARAADVRSVPVPVLELEDMGVFEWIEGRAVEPADLDDRALEAALGLVEGLALHQGAATHLGAASDACLHSDDHHEAVNFRIARLPHSGVLHDFLQGEFKQLYARHSFGLEIPNYNERCLSPSDFGFHNALLQANGRFRFVDFEYAGWDDPAKMVCDFFWQPQLPVPREWWPRFTTILSPQGRERARKIMPMHGLKWCCIVLQSLLPDTQRRREFAGSPQEVEAQLAKARHILQQIRELPTWLT